MQEWAREALAASGFSQYEVSSYARPGKRAVHNSLYWSGAPYLGVGASASSFRPLADGSGWRLLHAGDPTHARSTASYVAFRVRQTSSVLIIAGGTTASSVTVRMRSG